MPNASNGSPSRFRGRDQGKETRWFNASHMPGFPSALQPVGRLGLKHTQNSRRGNQLALGLSDGGPGPLYGGAPEE